MSIYYILVNLFTNSNINEPVRLEKPIVKYSWYETLCIYLKFIFVLMEMIIEFIQRNFYLIMIVLAFIGFILGVFHLTGLSAVESGLVYNHLQEVI